MRNTRADVIQLYGAQPLARRLYLRVRSRLVPLADIDRHVPPSGRILDAACGYGLLANYLALREPRRQVTGVDLAADRVAAARSAARGLPNVHFEIGDLARLEAQDLDALLLIDTLHYFPEEEQLAILRRCRRALSRGGLLVLRDAVREPTLRFCWNYLHEAVMVGGAFTTTKARRLFFLPLDRLRSLVERAGFAVHLVEPPRRLVPYTDTVIVAAAA